jgi:gamma-glutamylcyclotransferase (GGCT)/AIG2-like uncharacterized protein YtfP
MKLFVYGTLKRGQRNHKVLDAAFIGETEIDGFAAVNRQTYPYAIRQDGHKLKGEIYEVPSLKYIDKFENYPDEYDRVVINTEFGEAWIYIANDGVVDDIENVGLTDNWGE